MASLSVQPLQNQPTLNPKVVTNPVQPALNPQVVTRPVQAVLNPKVVIQPQQPQLNPQVQPIASQPQINVDNSPRFVPLGEAVKAKYPGVYDSIDSGILGKTVAIKYPGIYDSLIIPGTTPDQPEPEGLHGIKGFGLGVVKGALSTIKNTASLIASHGENSDPYDVGLTGLGMKLAGKLAKPVSTFLENKADLNTHSTAEKVGFGAEQVGEFLLPASKVAKVGKAADVGIEGLNLVSKFGKAGVFAETVLKLGSKASLGAAESAGITKLQGGSKSDVKTAGVLGAVFPILSAGVEAVLKSVPQTAWSSILKRTPVEAAKNPKLTQQAAETGLTGLTRQSLANKAGTAIQSIEVTLDDLLSKSDGKINTAKIAGYLSDLRNSYAVIPGETSSVKAIDDIAAELYNSFKAGQSMTVVEANQLKRNIYQVIAKSYGKGMLELPAKTEAQKLIASGLKQEIEKVIPEAKTLNQKQAVYIQIKKALDKTIARTEGKGIAGTGVGLYDLLLAGVGTGAGALTGSPLLGLGLVATKKTAESPLVLSSTAKLLTYFNSLSPTKKLLFYQGIKGLTVESGIGVKNAVSP